jgi:maleate isomerase
MTNQSLSWRGRVGVVIPQLDHLTEPILARILPSGLSFHVSRMPRTGPATPESLLGMNESVFDAVDLLPLPYLDLVVYHCTGGSLLYGPERLIQDIETRTGLPAVATMLAVMEALRHLKVTRLSLVTPYVRSLTDAEVKVMEARGFEVLAVGGDEFDDGGIIQHLAPEEISLWARRVPREGSQAIFISCTGIRSLEFIDELEADLGLPVVTSTQATVWSILRRLHLQTPISGLGRLFKEGSTDDQRAASPRTGRGGRGPRGPLTPADDPIPELQQHAG